MGNISQTPFIPAPWSLLPFDAASYGTGALTANTCYLAGVTLYGNAVLTGLRTRFGAGGNGNYDIGIYDANGNLLASKGAGASVTGIQTYTLPTPLNLLPGRYNLAFWINNATDTVSRAALPVAGIGVSQSGGNNTNLPATTASITSLANNATSPLIIGLLQNGWS